MNIKNLMQELHDSSTEKEKQIVEGKIKLQFSLLSESEKKEVQKHFMEGLDEKLSQANSIIKKADDFLEIAEI